MLPLLLLTSLVLAAAVSWEMILPGILLAGLVGASFPLLMIRYRQQLFTLHDHHIEHRSGVLWKRHTHARYDDVKKISIRRYAGTRRGRVTVFVAGETEVQTGKGQSVAVPNTFTAHYLPDVLPFYKTLDPLLQGRIEASAVSAADDTAAEGAEYRPAVANSLTTLILVGFLFPPLWLMVPYVIVSVKRRVYRVEADRAVLEEGVLYRSHTSVLFERIDSLQQAQGALGKAFSNGTVTLLTAGSSRPDLVLGNTPGYGELYAAIRERYGG